MSQSRHTYRTVGKVEDEDVDPMVVQLKECSEAYMKLEASAALSGVQIDVNVESNGRVILQYTECYGGRFSVSILE